MYHLLLDPDGGLEVLEDPFHIVAARDFPGISPYVGDGVCVTFELVFIVSSQVGRSIFEIDRPSKSLLYSSMKIAKSKLCCMSLICGEELEGDINQVVI